MKIVLDANIFVSALMRGGNPATIIRWIVRKFDTLFTTDEIIDEVEDVISRPKFGLTEKEVKYKIQNINEMSTRITVTERVTTGGCRDKTDNKYLECAIAANADYIISGDIHLRELKEYRGVKIVNAAEYLEIVGGRLD